MSDPAENSFVLFLFSTWHKCKINAYTQWIKKSSILCVFLKPDCAKIFNHSFLALNLQASKQHNNNKKPHLAKRRNKSWYIEVYEAKQHILPQ